MADPVAKAKSERVKDEQVVEVVAAGAGQVGPDFAPLPIQAMARGADLVEEGAAPAAQS